MKSRPSVQGSFLFVSTNIFQPISHACDACFYSVKCNFAKVQVLKYGRISKESVLCRFTFCLRQSYVWPIAKKTTTFNREKRRKIKRFRVFNVAVFCNGLYQRPPSTFDVENQLDNISQINNFLPKLNTFI